MRKKTAFILVLCMLLLCFVACGQTPDASNDPSAPEGGDNPSLNEPERTLTLVENGATEYRIVCEARMLKNNQMMQVMMTVVDQFQRRTGVTIDVVADTESTPTEKEILIGSTAGRKEGSEAMQRITSPDQTGYRVSVLGERVLISCNNARLLGSAISLFLDGLIDLGDGRYGISTHFDEEMDLPSPSASSNPVVNYTGEGNYTAIYNNVNYMTYVDYLAALEQNGFVFHSSNHFGRNYFATYVKEIQSCSMAVHVMFFEKLYRMEITYGENDEFLPPTETVTTGSAGKVTPSISQIAREGADQSAPGMSSIIQLSDASFVIFDGGPYNADDEISLYQFMKERTPAGQKPVIAAWIITHAHGDHMGLANSFLVSYRNLVDLRMGAFNFPDFDTVTINNESAATMGSMAKTFQNTVKSYPDATCWVMHTGQVLKLPDCEIRVLYTSEDAGSTKFSWGNHTCTAVRVTVKNTTFVVLGDSEKTLCQQMSDAYGTALRSDILSLSHHGFNGACLDLYKNVNPAICFWPVDSARFNEDPRCTGAQSGYSFNAWLRNDSVRKREHYTADETATILC